jgi:hypothetical protein
MQALRLWMAPYKQRVLSKLNQFDEVTHLEHNHMHSVQAKTKSIQKSLFEPGSVTANLPLRSISSNKQKVDFVSTSPINAARMYAHIAYWRHCVDVSPPHWEMSRRLWLSKLMTQGMLVRHKTELIWSFVVVGVSDTATLAWRAETALVNGVALYRPLRSPQADGYYKWLITVDFREWEGYEGAWVGEGWRLCNSAALGAAASSDAPPPNKRLGASSILPSTVAPIPLLQLSARDAFRNFGLASLRELAKLHDPPIDIPAIADLFDGLLIMLKAILPGLSEIEYEDILNKRVDTFLDLSPNFFDAPEIRESFDEHDIKELDRWKETTEKQNCPKFREKIDKYRFENYERACVEVKVPKAAAKKYEKIIRGKVSEGTRLYADLVKADSITEKHALVYLPEGSRVYRSPLDNRFRLSYKKFEISRSWVLYGELRAFAICAKRVWLEAAKDGWPYCPFDWINAEAEVPPAAPAVEPAVLVVDAV